MHWFQFGVGDAATTKRMLALFQYVWCLFCDVVCLNYDGNLTDAALVALVAALQDLRLPATNFDADEQRLQVEPLRTVKVNVKVKGEELVPSPSKILIVVLVFICPFMFPLLIHFHLYHYPPSHLDLPLC